MPQSLSDTENWCPGYLEHALCSSEIHLAAAKSLEIIGHVTNCCKRPIELILAKSGCFTTPVNIQEMTIICPLHRERLGIGWRRSIIQCSVPEELAGHDDTAKQKAELGCTWLQSKLILQATEKIRSSRFW